MRREFSLSVARVIESSRVGRAKNIKKSITGDFIAQMECMLSIEFNGNDPIQRSYMEAYVALDVETVGALREQRFQITELSIYDGDSLLVDFVLENGDDILNYSLRLSEILGRFHVCGHNIMFDLCAVARAVGGFVELPTVRVVDTLDMARSLGLEPLGLQPLCARFELDVDPGALHTARADARACWLLLDVLEHRVDLDRYTRVVNLNYLLP